MLVVLAVLVASGLLLWVRSLWGSRISAMQEMWGPALVLVAFVSLPLSEMGGLRPVLTFTLAMIWGLRLTVTSLRRLRVPAEAHDLVEARQRWGTGFRRRSLVRVFGFQVVAVWVCTLALQHGIIDAAPLPFGLIDLLGVLAWAVGMVVAMVADRQLARFRGTPDNVDQVLKTGLWRYSRHPNYFGEILIAVGLYLVASGGGTGLESLPAPIMFTALLLRVTGIPRSELGIDARRPGYAAYRQVTSAVLPLPPGQLLDDDVPIEYFGDWRPDQPPTGGTRGAGGSR